MTKHSEATVIHKPYNWEYADQTAREAATGFVPADVGKLARQLDDNSLWMLTDDSPETWVTVGGTTSGSSLVNSNISPTTSNVAAAVNTRYFADVSGLTANRNFVLPACAGGNEIELKVMVGDDTYALIAIGDTGVVIEGGSAATEWSRLFISGETVRFVADGTDSWRVVHDGRLPCIGQMSLSAADTTNSAGGAATPTWDNKVIDRGNLCDTTNFRFNVRRAGYHRLTTQARPNSAVTDGKSYSINIQKNGTPIVGAGLRGSATSSVLTVTTSAYTVLCAVGDALLMQYTAEEANKGIVNGVETFFQVQEVF